MGLKDTKPNVSAVFVEIYRCIPQVPVFLHKEWNKGTDVLYSNAQFQKCIKNLYADLMYSHSCSLWTLSSITKQPCLSLCYKYTAMATAPVCPPYSISFPSALKTPICKYQWNLVEKLDNDPGCHWLTDAQHPGEVSVSWWKQTRLCRDAPRVEWHSLQHVEYRSSVVCSGAGWGMPKSRSTWLLPGIMGTAPPCAAKCPLSLTHLSRAPRARNWAVLLKIGLLLTLSLHHVKYYSPETMKAWGPSTIKPLSYSEKNFANINKSHYPTIWNI